MGCLGSKHSASRQVSAPTYRRSSYHQELATPNQADYFTTTPNGIIQTQHYSQQFAANEAFHGQQGRQHDSHRQYDAYRQVSSRSSSVSQTGPIQGPVGPTCKTQGRKKTQLVKERQNVFTAIFAYKAQEGQEHVQVSFEKGDKFLVVQKQYPDWWYVTCLKNSQSGLAPANYLTNTITDDWFFGAISRRDAEQLLNAPGVVPGTFLIRKKEHKSNGLWGYSLSMRDDQPGCMDNVKHYRIRIEGSKYFITHRACFESLAKLIEFYQRNDDGLVTKLTRPCLMPAPVNSSLVDDRWEYPRENIRFEGEPLGHGQFGDVYQGTISDGGKHLPVAIKTLKPHTMSAEAFLKEANVMKALQHRHLLRLYCVCTKEEPIYIVTELMKCSLLHFLREREGKNMTEHAIINMSVDIASGMAYLESKNFIHRDLAARNILVGELNNCKIADFGLARYSHEQCPAAESRSEKFPIKWTAPEAALNAQFSLKSDVWSFGILLYELVTKGGTPYPGMSNRQVLDAIRPPTNHRMERPATCPESLYRDVMAPCWRADPRRRPTFHAIHDYLDKFNTTSEVPYNNETPPLSGSTYNTLDRFQ